MTGTSAMTGIQLYNTLARAKQVFVPADPTRVTIYVCGPTVYHYAHIGNARPAVAFDVLFRLLRACYGAGHVMMARNFTDIDDKIIARARDTGEPIPALTRRFADIYRADMAALGNIAPDFEPCATDHVAGMLAMIARLIAKGHAYSTPSGVWFSVGSMPDYGKLSGRTLADFGPDSGPEARVEPMEDKKDPADFALWKAAKPGEPFWDSPFGPGRPGWHIECSAMIAALFGPTIDLHAGGHDLIFPHHENEIAQSECAHGAPLARFWLHNGFLTMDSGKMSKSLGNVVLIHDLLEAWPGEVLRLALLSGHYRAPLDYTMALLEQAKATLDRLYGALERAGTAEPVPEQEPAPEILAALADDLNTPQALAGLAGLAAAVNKAQGDTAIAVAAARLRASGQLMGLLVADPADWFRAKRDDADDARIAALVAARNAARTARDWAEADRLRAVLAEAGVEVLDGGGGSSWRRR